LRVLRSKEAPAALNWPVPPEDPRGNADRPLLQEQGTAGRAILGNDASLVSWEEFVHGPDGRGENVSCRQDEGF